jgi:hypothetical protein
LAIAIPLFHHSAIPLFHHSNKSRFPEFTQLDSKSESPSDTTEIVRQENARLKANAALEGQQRLEKQATKARPNSKSASKQSGKPLKVAISRAVAPPSTISIRQSESPRLVTAPVPRSEALPTRPVALKSSHTQATNPAQRWQELAEIGSYGSTPERIAQPESSRSQRPLAPIQTLSSVPEPRSATSHLTVNPAVDRNNLQPDPILLVDKNNDRSLPISSYLPILQLERDALLVAFCLSRVWFGRKCCDKRQRVAPKLKADSQMRCFKPSIDNLQRILDIEH